MAALRDFAYGQTGDFLWAVQSGVDSLREFV
jgi:hypothetical protein